MLAEMSRLTSFVVAAVVALAISAASASASACRYPPGFVPPPNQTGLHWGIAIAAGTAVDVGIIVGQLAENEELFPEWLAAIELGLGIAESVGAGAIWIYGNLTGFTTCDSDPWQRYGMWSAAALAAAGGWLIAHAIWSLAASDAPELAPSVAVSPHGATFALIGTF